MRPPLARMSPAASASIECCSSDSRRQSAPSASATGPSGVRAKPRAALPFTPSVVPRALRTSPSMVAERSAASAVGRVRTERIDHARVEDRQHARFLHPALRVAVVHGRHVVLDRDGGVPVRRAAVDARDHARLLGHGLAGARPELRRAPQHADRPRRIAAQRRDERAGVVRRRRCEQERRAVARRRARDRRRRQAQHELVVRERRLDEGAHVGRHVDARHADRVQLARRVEDVDGGHVVVAALPLARRRGERRRRRARGIRRVDGAGDARDVDVAPASMRRRSRRSGPGCRPCARTGDRAPPARPRPARRSCRTPARDRPARRSHPRASPAIDGRPRPATRPRTPCASTPCMCVRVMKLTMPPIASEP